MPLNLNSCASRRRPWDPANFFEGTAAPLVRAMVSGRQAENVIMSYGITSSGKTYTIEGTRAAPGLIYRAVALLFKVETLPLSLPRH